MTWKANWQDKVLTIVGSLFGVLLLPQLMDVINTGAKMNIFSCFATSAGLFVTAFVYSSLKMRWAVVTSVLTGAVWFFLGVFSL